MAYGLANNPFAGDFGVESPLAGGPTSTGMPAGWLTTLMQQLNTPGAFDKLSMQAGPPSQQDIIQFTQTGGFPQGGGLAAAANNPANPPLLPQTSTGPSFGGDFAGTANAAESITPQKQNLGALLTAAGGFIPKPAEPKFMAAAPHAPSLGGGSAVKPASVGPQLQNPKRSPLLNKTLGELLGV